MTTELAERRDATIQPGSEAGTYALAMLSEQDFALRLESLKQGRERIAEIQKKLMRPGVDYGKIPGTGDRPTLLKPGAEKLADFYRFAAGMDARMEPGDGETSPLIRYEVRCTLHLGSLDGPIVATGWGVCTSHEKKYRYRNEWHGNGPSRTKTRVVNDDPWEQANTILKIAEKRAFIDAVLRATASSGLFTQDVGDDDLPDDQPERSGSGAVGPRSGAPISAPAPRTKGEALDQYADALRRHGKTFSQGDAIAKELGINRGTASVQEIVDLIAAIESPSDGVGTPSTAEGASETARASGAPPTPSSEAATAQAGEIAPPDTQPVPDSTGLFDAVLETTGGELVPPKPGSDEYRALPTAQEKAQARAYWQRNEVPA